jgi:HEPN domain-containing protein
VERDLVAAARRWVVRAEHDLKVAEHTLEIPEDCPFEVVGFHGQQCAEKYLKALLVLKAIDFPKTHDLRYLVEMIPPELALGLDLTDLALLNRYAVEGRYPDAWGEPDRAEAE